MRKTLTVNSHQSPQRARSQAKVENQRKLTIRSLNRPTRNQRKKQRRTKQSPTNLASQQKVKQKEKPQLSFKKNSIHLSSLLSKKKDGLLSKTYRISFTCILLRNLEQRRCKFLLETHSSSSCSVLRSLCRSTRE